MKKFHRIFARLKAYRGKIVLYFIFVALTTFFSVFSLAMLGPFMAIIFKTGNGVVDLSSGQLKYVGDLLNHAMESHGRMYAVRLVCIFIIISIALKNLFTYLSSYTITPIRSAVVTNIRDDIYNKILQLPVGYFTEQKKGDLMSRMTNDVGEVENSIVATMEGLISDPLMTLGYLCAMIYVSPSLSLFLLILLPVTAFIIGRISRSLKTQSQASSEKLGGVLSIMDETLTGIRVVKAFLAEKLLYRKFSKLNNEVFVLRNKMTAKRDLASPLTEILGVVVLCVILYFGAILVIDKKTMAGQNVIIYISFFAMMINPAKNLSRSFFNMKKGAAALERINEILETPLVVKDEGVKTLEKFHTSIEFRNVTFSYGKSDILKNINFTIPYGKTVALVGSSGAGKSTLADLVPRFHDATSGEILVDGVDIRSYSLESLRTHIGIVTQEPILFNESIAENIALGVPNASKSDIEEAAKVANAYNFIQKKSAGFDENVGDRGSKLSGGEKQRLTIARAILKNPSILILDEATSSLDTESERLVQNAIDKMMANRTVLVIAHRLSTIRDADEIVVMHKGQIVERGTHEDLMKIEEGFYRNLVEMQTGNA